MSYGDFVKDGGKVDASTGRPTFSGEPAAFDNIKKNGIKDFPGVYRKRADRTNYNPRSQKLYRINYENIAWDNR